MSQSIIITVTMIDYNESLIASRIKAAVVALVEELGCEAVG